MNSAVGDARQSEIDAISASIAMNYCCVITAEDKKSILTGVHDWETGISPAWAEHKEALAFGVSSTPKHVIMGCCWKIQRVHGLSTWRKERKTSFLMDESNVMRLCNNNFIS
ncbi:hypothetical protein ACHAXN_012750 [Cyclotella atomus]